MNYIGFLMWTPLKKLQRFSKLHKGTKGVKNAKLQMVNTQFVELRMKDDKPFNSFHAKLNEIVKSAWNLSHWDSVSLENQIHKHLQVFTFISS